MFRSSAANPYEDIVVKATDENLTAENWELIITLCDKVTDEGEAGARSVVAAVIKRLTHRNPNVQLYALALAESLTKNCGVDLHREISSKSFTTSLEKIITDRTTHDRVKKRALVLIAMWAGEFENNPSLGIMEECYTGLKARGYKFDVPDEVPPVKVDDDLRRKEEEELQRVLEMSVHDKGGREQWSNYLASNNGAGGSGSGSSSALHTSQPVQRVESHRRTDSLPSAGASGSTAQLPVPGGSYTQPPRAEPPSPIVQATPTEVPTTSPQSPTITRVRALHKFEATEPGELAFEKGDVIKVVDRIYKDWWRGQLRGRTGIFPVNYVEPLAEPTPAEIAKEGEQEAAIFAQAANIDKLLTMLRNLDPAKDNLADNEEIQELYRTSMSLRPKIVKLIDRYNQKKAELVSMNDTFIKAKTIFDGMMEESLARHSGSLYDPGYGPRPHPVWNVAYDQGPNVQQQYDQPMYTHTPQPYQQQPTPTPGAFPAHPYTQAPQSPVPQQVLPGMQIQAPNQQPHGPPGQYPHQVHPPQFAPPIQQGQQESVPNGLGAAGHYSGPQQPLGHPEQPQQAQQQAPPMDPPYDYDPAGQYPDANATAWARYYAQGGKDLAGAVYFKSIPGIKESSPGAPAPGEAETIASNQGLQGTKYPSLINTAPPQDAGQGQLSSGPAYQSQEVQQQQPVNTLHSPTGQNPTQPNQSFVTSGYGQAPYPQHVAQPTSPYQPNNSFVYPGQPGNQPPIDELQRQFSSHNIQA